MITMFFIATLLTSCGGYLLSSPHASSNLYPHTLDRPAADDADKRGAWRSAIFRTPAVGPIELGLRGLAGDQVANTENHGSPDQRAGQV